MKQHGPWPMHRHYDDKVWSKDGDGNIFRMDKYGIVFVNGNVVGKFPVCDVDDTRDYLEVVSGGA